MDFCAGIGAGRLGLENNGLSCVGFSEIDKIVVAVGPGSFTGIRTGVSFAQGISTARESLLYGLDVISARFALLLPNLSAGVYCATLRANKSEFFFRSFVVSGDNSLGEISEIGVVEEGELDTKFDPATLIDLDSLDLEQRCSVGMVTAWYDENFAEKRLFQQSCPATPLELLYVKPVHALTIAERQARAQDNNR